MTLPEIINQRIDNNPLEIQIFLNENPISIMRQPIGITFNQKIDNLHLKLVSFEHYSNKIMGDTIIIYRGNKLSFFNLNSTLGGYVFLDGSINSKRLTIDIVPQQVKQLMELLDIQIVTHKVNFVMSNQNIEVVDKLIV